jgi:arylsulfatase A-like enzyme
MTGRYTFTYKPWSPLGTDEVTLADTLKKAEVITSLVVDTPHPFAPGFNYQRGFQAWELIRGQEHDPWKTHPREVKFPCKPEKLRNPHGTVVQYLRNVHDRVLEEDYFPARTMRTAAQWLENNYKSRFFLYVDTFDPHEPWDPPQYYVDLYDPGYEGEEVIYPSYDKCDYLTESELKHCRALYAGEVTLVDRWIGLLLNRAESLGLFSNTAIIIISDHGFYIGEHGYIGKSLITSKYQQAIPLYTEVSAIPMLIYLPGLKGSKRLSTFAQPVDIMPTILDLMEAPIPPTVQGKSLRPILEGKMDLVKEVAIASPTISSQNLQVPHPTSRSSIVSDNWMLVYGSQVDKVTEPEVTQMVDSLMRRVQTLEKGPIRPELYNLVEDPYCSNNIINANFEVAKALHAEYIKFLEWAQVPEKHLRFFREI